VVDTAKSLAKVAVQRKLTAPLGKYLGTLTKGKLSATDVTAIGNITYTDAEVAGVVITGVTVATTKDELINILATKATEKSQEATIYSNYLVLAKTELKKESLEDLKKRLTAEAQTTVEAQLATQFTQERGAADIAGFVGAGPVIADFWTKRPAEQLDAIVTKANQTKIPFGSSDTAAYHALKHYPEIKDTADAATGGTSNHQLNAYLTSAWETVKTPSRKRSEQQQLYHHPSFFFYRTVAKAATAEGKDQTMRAIVAVADNGAVNLITYFQAPD
jgi:hypothetical protein